MGDMEVGDKPAACVAEALQPRNIPGTELAARCALKNAITAAANSGGKHADLTRIQKATEDLCDVVAKEAVRAALQPRAPSPELAESGRWLESMAKAYDDRLGHLVEDAGKLPRVIAAELDRLRAEVELLKLAQPAPAQDGDRATREVYVVRLGNYETAEVDSIWDDVASAQSRCNELGSMWVVEEWPVGESADQAAEGDE
jgi:hypothetical protein